MAIKLYDSNGDGRLGAEELEKSPSLAASLRRLDRNRDGALTPEEIKARFEERNQWAKYVAIDATFTYRGRPLVGAEVTLAPEPFMGKAYPTYSATTGEGGTAALETDGAQYPATPSGFYTLRIFHAGQGIDEVRGVEICDDTTGSRMVISL